MFREAFRMGKAGTGQGCQYNRKRSHLHLEEGMLVQRLCLKTNKLCAEEASI